MCIVSMPAIRTRAQPNDLNPSIGRTTRLMARWYAMKVYGPFEETARRRLVAVRPEQEVHRVAIPIDGAVQVLPLPADFDVGFVHTPAPADRAFAPPKHQYQHGQDL